MADEIRIKSLEEQIRSRVKGIGVSLPFSMYEDIWWGDLPSGFESHTRHRVYVENIHRQVTNLILQQVFTSVGPCKIIHKEESSYGFVDYSDQGLAILAAAILNGRHLFAQPIKVSWACDCPSNRIPEVEVDVFDETPKRISTDRIEEQGITRALDGVIKVNYAYTNAQREDASSPFDVPVGILSPEIRVDNMLDELLELDFVDKINYNKAANDSEVVNNNDEPKKEVEGAERSSGHAFHIVYTAKKVFNRISNLEPSVAAEQNLATPRVKTCLKHEVGNERWLDHSFLYFPQGAGPDTIGFLLGKFLMFNFDPGGDKNLIKEWYISRPDYALQYHFNHVHLFFCSKPSLLLQIEVSFGFQILNVCDVESNCGQ